MTTPSEQLLAGFSPEERDRFLAAFAGKPAAFVASLLAIYRDPDAPQAVRDRIPHALHAVVELVAEALGSIQPSDLVDVDQLLEMSRIAVRLERTALGLETPEEL